MSDWNAGVISEFRAKEGRVGGPFEGAAMILIHHVGAKTGTAETATGTPHSWFVAFAPVEQPRFAIAVIVHGLMHEGRLSRADSFSRLAFHAVPLFFWYLGTVAGGLVQTLSSPRSTR